MATIRSKTGVRKVYKEFKKAHKPSVELAFYLQDWEDAYNVGSLFRVADAVGSDLVVMSGKTPQPPDPMIPVTSLGAHRRIPYHHFPRHDDAVAFLKAEGWSLVAVEIAEGAVNFRDFTFPPRTCLILGNEGAGIYGNVMKASDAVVYIPQFGKGRSMNVHVAAAVVAYEAVLQTTGQK
ncbi:MAG: TrmH family RNA methyltransferase [Armatimonadota bacterium]